MINFFFRVLNSLKRRLSTFVWSLRLKSIGENTVIDSNVKIYNPQNISIGSSCVINAGVILQSCEEGEIVIGDNLSLNTNVQIGSSSGKIHIGNNVLIGPNVVLRAADHGISRYYAIQRQPHIGGVITVEDDVWIGANAVILRNVKLGRGCVVAAGSVVTKDVEPYSIVGGVSAKKICERV